MHSVESKSAWIAGLLAAVGALALSCAPPRATSVPAAADERAALLRQWETFRGAMLSRGRGELLYDAEVSRKGFSGSGTVAVKDDPGKSLSLQVDGPLGWPLARARWDGEKTTVETFRKGKMKTLDGEDGALEETLGVPLTARAFSYLFFGLPEPGPAGSVSRDGEAVKLAWPDAGIECDFDPGAKRVRRIAFQAERSVEILFLDWEGDFPSHMRAQVSTGGSAELTLRSAEFSAAP